ncbi:hypothetical protein CTI12_AA185080 [Artemisia annua]|uniref:COI1 F-box domain-containing protein n=1 Tax=Artemisia annua TaxID=35608 RepID=A0A2U1P729_ARTAN|nr:hypothetical protein CTI12_AA185080 [Artemisia annua]
MAPTKRKLEKTNVWEEVLDLVMPYIHNGEDQTSVSLVSRRFYEIDRITRKRVTVHAYYYLNPASLSERFPFLEALTLKGPPFIFNDRGGYAVRVTPWIEELELEDSPPFIFNDRGGYAVRVTPWIEELELEDSCLNLKELDICGLVVNDEDLKTLAQTRGMDLTSLKISKCEGFSTKGLWYVSRYCNRLRTLCVEYSDYRGHQVNDGVWIRQLALNSTGLERFHVTGTDFFNVEELTLLAKNCCNSLISLKIGDCHLSNLGDAFRYTSRLEHFSGNNWDEESELVGFRFPPNTRSLNVEDLPLTGYSIVLPFLNHLRKLKLVRYSLEYVCQCLLFKSCPNLEVLYTEDVCGDEGLQVIGQFCKKLRKLTHNGLVTHVGLIAMAKGCTNLESLNFRLGDISNEALECLGMHLKNLRKFRMKLVKKNGITDLPLDDGILDMLLGCKKLERLDITLRYDYVGLTDVGLGYIGKYGVNLRSLALKCVGNSNAGLVKLSKGCPNLRELKLRGCPFSEQVVTSSVFNIPSLRYVWFDSCDRHSSDLERSDLERSDLEISDFENSDHVSSDHERSSDLESSDCENSDHVSSDHERSSDLESSDCESIDRESSDLESSDRVRCHLALTHPEFELWYDFFQRIICADMEQVQEMCTIEHSCSTILADRDCIIIHT